MKAAEPCITIHPREVDFKPAAVEPAKPIVAEPAASNPPLTATAPQRSISPTLEEVESKEEAKELLVLRILEDIPPFAGPFGNYRLRREDVATLPAGIGRALVKRGKAVEIAVPRA